MNLQEKYEQTVAITNGHLAAVQQIYESASQQIAAQTNNTVQQLAGVDVAQLQAENAALKAQLAALQPSV